MTTEQGSSMIMVKGVAMVQVPAEPGVCAHHSGCLHDEGPHQGVGQALPAARLCQLWLRVSRPHCQGEWRV